MRLTLYTDYALRVLIHLGIQEDGRLVTISEIAKAFKISKNHLSKVTHKLSAGAYIEAVRGNGGGLRLAHHPSGINIGAVVRFTESDFALVGCFEKGHGCRIETACLLRPALRTALAAFFAALDKYTLQDLLVARPLLEEMLPRPRKKASRGAMYGSVPLLP